MISFGGFLFFMVDNPIRKTFRKDQRDETRRYEFQKLKGEKGALLKDQTDRKVRTFFVHYGEVMLHRQGHDSEIVEAGEGFLAPPGIKYELCVSIPFYAVQANSNI